MNTSPLTLAASALRDYLKSLHQGAEVYVDDRITTSIVDSSPVKVVLVREFNFRNFTVGLFDIHTVSGSFLPTGNKIETLTVVRFDDYGFFKIYRSMADMETALLHQILDIPNHVVLMKTIGLDMKVNDSAMATTNGNNEAYFIDGSAYKYAVIEQRTKSMVDLAIPPTQKPYNPHYRMPTQPQHNETDEHLSRLSQRIGRLENIVLQRTMKCGDYELKLIDKPAFGGYSAKVKDSANDTALYIFPDKRSILVARGDEWYAVEADPVEFVEYWYSELLTTAKGWQDIANSRHFAFCGTWVYDMSIHHSTPDVNGMIEVLNANIPAGAKFYISPEPTGVRTMVLSYDGLHMVMKYVAEHLQTRRLVLSKPINTKPATMIAGYAYNSTLGKKYDKPFNDKRVAAVRATTTQVWNTEKLTYRRDNQLAINKDFTLEKLPNDNKLVELGRATENGGDLYRFKFEDGDNVYAYYTGKGTDKPQPVVLNEADTAIMNTIKGKASKGKLYKHCVKLAKQYDL